MDLHDQQIQKLIAWNIFWLVFLAVCFLGCGLFGWGYSALNNATSLKLRTTDSGDLRFSSGSDGPFIITHLITYESEWGRAAAALPEPIAFYDSGGVSITRKEIQSLNWINSQGDSVKAPDSSKIKVLYFSAQKLADKELANP